MKIRPVTVSAPPSKSLSHRKMIASSLARGTSRLSGVLESEDLARTIDVLTCLGAVIERAGEGEYTVTGIGGPPRMGPGASIHCFMGESGTTCRLLTAVIASGSGEFHIYGSGRLHERPMRDLSDALETLGAEVAFAGVPGHLPMTVKANGLSQPGGESWLPVPGDVSSQFLSGLLLAAPLAQNGLGLFLSGERPVSWPYIVLTLQTLEDAGCAFAVETLDHGQWKAVPWRSLSAGRPGMQRFRVLPGLYKPLAGDKGVVEGDYSGASYLLAAGAAGPRPVRVTGLSPGSLQGDAVILDILAAMGASVVWEEGAVTVSPGFLNGIDIDMAHCPDLVPTVAVLAAMGTGVTTIRGVPHLREKESDRLSAPSQELAKIGCSVDVVPDGLVITPAPGKFPEGPVYFSAHNDHRMAMSLALLGFAGVAVILDAPGCVAKSFPNFWDTWREIRTEPAVASL